LYMDRFTPIGVKLTASEPCLKGLHQGYHFPEPFPQKGPVWWPRPAPVELTCPLPSHFESSIFEGSDGDSDDGPPPMISSSSSDGFQPPECFKGKGKDKGKGKGKECFKGKDKGKGKGEECFKGKGNAASSSATSR
jgi:hypothetical protein